MQNNGNYIKIHNSGHVCAGCTIMTCAMARCVPDALRVAINLSPRIRMLRSATDVVCFHCFAALYRPLLHSLVPSSVGNSFFLKLPLENRRIHLLTRCWERISTFLVNGWMVLQFIGGSSAGGLNIEKNKKFLCSIVAQLDRALESTLSRCSRLLQLLA